MDRRLTIFVIGLVMLLDMILMAWLTAIGKEIPSELAGVVLLGLGALCPSPLSKSSVPTDADPPAAASVRRPSVHPTLAAQVPDGSQDLA